MSTTVEDTTASPLLGSTNTDEYGPPGGGEYIDELGRQGCCRPQPLAMVYELILNTIVVTLAIVVLTVLGKGETTKVPLRVWIVGFVVVRLLRMVCVSLNNTRQTTLLGRVTKCLNAVNLLLNAIWWIIGLCWMFSGGKALANDAPKLFWFTVLFLTFDLLINIVAIFAFVTCTIFVAGFCCLQFRMIFLNTESRQCETYVESADGSMNGRNTDTPHDVSTENAV